MTVSMSQLNPADDDCLVEREQEAKVDRNQDLSLHYNSSHHSSLHHSSSHHSCDTTASTAKKGSTAAAKRTWRKSKDKPKRPLSAYNMFFQNTRERIVAGKDGDATPEEIKESIEIILKSKVRGPKRRQDRISHGRISFGDLARTIADKWKEINPKAKAVYDHYASLEKARYRKELLIWKNKKESEHAAKVLARNAQQQGFGGSFSAGDTRGSGAATASWPPRHLSQSLGSATVSTSAGSLHSSTQSLSDSFQFGGLPTRLTSSISDSISSAHSIHSSGGGGGMPLVTSSSSHHSSSSQQQRSDDAVIRRQQDILRKQMGFGSGGDDQKHNSTASLSNSFNNSSFSNNNLSNSFNGGMNSGNTLSSWSSWSSMLLSGSQASQQVANRLANSGGGTKRMSVTQQEPSMVTSLSRSFNDLSNSNNNPLDNRAALLRQQQRQQLQQEQQQRAQQQQRELEEISRKLNKLKEQQVVMEMQLLEHKRQQLRSQSFTAGGAGDVALNNNNSSSSNNNIINNNARNRRASQPELYRSNNSTGGGFASGNSNEIDQPYSALDSLRSSNLSRHASCPSTIRGMSGNATAADLEWRLQQQEQQMEELVKPRQYRRNSLFTNDEMADMMAAVLPSTSRRNSNNENRNNRDSDMNDTSKHSDSNNSSGGPLTSTAAAAPTVSNNISDHSNNAFGMDFPNRRGDSQKGSGDDVDSLFDTVEPLGDDGGRRKGGAGADNDNIMMREPLSDRETGGLSDNDGISVVSFGPMDDSEDPEFRI